jgi:hypothetical protein
MEKKQTEDDDLIIIVSPMHHPHYTKGRVCECARCHKEAWLSDTSIDAVKEKMPDNPVQFICLNCFAPYMKEKKEELNFFSLTDAQKDEIKNSI